MKSAQYFLIVAIWCSLAAAAEAESPMEKTGVNSLLEIAPTAADILSALHQFDLFEQDADETAQQRGDRKLKQFSSDHADEAGKRDKQLTSLAKKASVNVAFSEEPSGGANNRLAGLQGSVGSAFIENYYAAQAAEYRSILSTLRRYLAKPDNDQIKSFVAKQIPELEASCKIFTEIAKRTTQ